MAVTTASAAPYAPPSAVLEVVARYRNRGLSTPITGEVLARAGVSESLVPRTLQALQILDLVNDKGMPTDTLEGLRKAPEQEFKARLADWLNGAYADVLKFIDPATASETDIRDAFRYYNPIGQQPRMVTLFMGLYAAAGIGPERQVAAPRPNARTSQPRPRVAQGKPTPPRYEPRSNPKRQAGGLPPALAGLLDSLPDPEEGWTLDERDKFYDTFGTVLDFCIPIVSERAADNGK